MIPFLHRIHAPMDDKKLYLSFIDWISDKRIDIDNGSWSFINGHTYYHYFNFHDEDDYIVFKLKFPEFTK